MGGGGGIPNKVRCPTPDKVWFRSAPKCEGAESRKLCVRDAGAAVGRRRNQSLKHPTRGTSLPLEQELGCADMET
eukprot:COSAG05_NODE_21_length_32397_cov_125.224008_5_plen_75_part_00